jgi:hypothetical protein
METFYHFINTTNEIIFSDFPQELTHLITSKEIKNHPITVTFIGKKTQCRFGYRTNKEGTLFICTFNKEFINNLKKFRGFFKISLASLESMNDFRKKIMNNQNKLTQELIHNLVSLNTHNIQGLYALIPQKLLNENVNKQNETVKRIIIEKPIITAETLLRQIKNNLALKVEFSVFEKTMKKYPKVEKEEDFIRPKVLSILQIFMLDFDEKKIEVRMGSCEKRLLFDFESLSVSLYYLFDNIVKYSCQRTILNISFVEETDSFTIHLDMSSLRIEPNEIDRLCENEYRSPTAQKLNSKGSGIGMFRLQKTLKLNNAVLEIIPRHHPTPPQKKGSYLYERNKFKIKFLDQQDWFKT